MKKLFIGMPLCLVALVLVAFQSKGPEIQKVGADLYKVPKGASMSKADQNTLKSIVMKDYKIAQFKKDQKFEMLTSGGGTSGAARSGRWLIERTVMEDFFKERAVLLNTTADAIRPDINTLSKILNKYTASTGTK